MSEAEATGLLIVSVVAILDSCRLILYITNAVLDYYYWKNSDHED